MSKKAKGRVIFARDFEIHGTVRGVYYQKHAGMQAKILGVKGWCMRTKEGSIKGHIEAPLDSITEMSHWLEAVGSPRSVIERAEFTPNQDIPTYTCKGFTIRPPSTR